MATNICFDCKNAVPDSEGQGCPWSRKFEPVPGWTAKAVRQRAPARQSAIETYEITDCPLFDPDDEGRRRSAGRSCSVRVRCIETGAVYNSLSEAGKAIGRNSSGIGDALKDGRSYAYGYHWEVVKDDG